MHRLHGRARLSGGKDGMSCDPCPASLPPTRIASSDADWAAEPPARLLGMAQQLILIRRFEHKLLWLKERDLINGPVHTIVGQEAAAVGAAAALTTADQIFGSHRAHHQYLAKVLNACTGKDYNPLQQEITADMAAAVI